MHKKWKKWGQACRPAVCRKMFSQSIGGFAGTVRKLLQEAQIKLAAFPFNKYGTVNGHVEYVSPDAAELPDTREGDRKDTREHVMPPSGFRTLVALDSPYLERDGKQFRVSAGMLVSAEVNLGSRTVMEYLLSPVQKVTHEAGRER